MANKIKLDRMGLMRFSFNLFSIGFSIDKVYETIVNGNYELDEIYFPEGTDSLMKNIEIASIRYKAVEEENEFIEKYILPRCLLIRNDYVFKHSILINIEKCFNIYDLPSSAEKTFSCTCIQVDYEDYIHIKENYHVEPSDLYTLKFNNDFDANYVLNENVTYIGKDYAESIKEKYESLRKEIIDF